MDRVPSIDPHSAGAKNLTQESTLHQVSMLFVPLLTLYAR
jgi:hypothetical protein